MNIIMVLCLISFAAHAMEDDQSKAIEMTSHKKHKPRLLIVQEPAALLEKPHEAITLNPHETETFTSDSFKASIRECKKNNTTYLLGVIRGNASDGAHICHFYDGRQLLVYYKKLSQFRDPQSNITVNPDEVRYYVLKDRAFCFVGSHNDVLKRDELGTNLINHFLQPAEVVIESVVSDTQPDHAEVPYAVQAANDRPQEVSVPVNDPRYVYGNDGIPYQPGALRDPCCSPECVAKSIIKGCVITCCTGCIGGLIACIIWCC